MNFTASRAPAFDGVNDVPDAYVKITAAGDTVSDP
jgi:hypothetical protein